MVGKTRECVWEIFGKFATHLNSLQKHKESIGEGPVDEPWEKVGSSLLHLAKEFHSQIKVWHVICNFLLMS